MNTKLLNVLSKSPDCYIYFEDPQIFTVYKEKPRNPLSEDYMGVITLYEGNMGDRTGHAPELVEALAECIAITVESRKEEEENDTSSV